MLQQNLITNNGHDGLYYTPDCRYFCVICGGKGYLVNPDNPKDVIYLPYEPITDVRCIPEKDLIIYIDPFEIIAYGKSGIFWKTNRISIEGIEIIEINNNSIVVEIDDNYEKSLTTIEIDMLTGKQIR